MRFISIILVVVAVVFLSFKDTKEQIGKASYYANRFNGRRTSSGEIFDQENMTAAHKTMKLGTFVKVTNLENDSVVVVKVNDRLGRSSGHIIDLSLKAAKKLNFVRDGSAHVKLEILE